MTRPSRKKGRRASRGWADIDHLEKASDKEIARTSPPELAGLPNDFWDGAVVVHPIPKRAISLRVDEDVLAWFKSSGPRYQSRMNAVLRSFMLHTSSRTSRSPGDRKARAGRPRSVG